MSANVNAPPSRATAAAGTVLLTLAAAQFLMTLDSSVMNVSISTVASDLGTTVTGIQTAITLYTLVMAALMITGGKLGQIYGRQRVFAVGCVVYGLGSFTTALAPNLTVLLIGWSLFEGIGAALILPAIVALVASNFGPGDRPRAYGLVAASGAIAVAVGPLIGGLLTTYASWRWVFAGEVVIVIAILALAKRMTSEPPDRSTHLDLAGTGFSALGLGLVVFGVLRAGSWGFVNPKPGAPSWMGISPVVWLVVAGGVVLYGFLAWERRRIALGHSALFDPVLLSNRQLRAGLTSFTFQYLLQSGLFFTVPLFLSVALGLSAVGTGVRLLPLSLALLVTAVGVPKFFPHTSPRRIVQVGFLGLLAGILSLAASLELGVGPEVVSLPMLIAGLGMGALSSQLGSVTVSAVPDEQSAEVGGVQNTLVYLGASLGTALAGAVLVSALTASFFSGVDANPAVPDDLSSAAKVELASGVPFMSDDAMRSALVEAQVDTAAVDAIVAANEDARLAGLRSALALLAVVAVLAVFLTNGLPTRQPGTSATATEDP
mgnify:FL=1